MTAQNIKRFEKLKQAFAKDNFIIKNFKEDPVFRKCEYVAPGGYLEFEGKIGILAEHKTAINIVSREPKRAYYIEGNNKQMGFLLGLMAEPQISVMSTDFIENFPFYFFKSCSPTYPPGHSIFDPLKEKFLELMSKGATAMVEDGEIPEQYIVELRWMLAGCKSINPDTKVKLDHLYALNFGMDFCLAQAYTGELQKKAKIPPTLLKFPFGCSALSVCGDAVEEGQHFFGRDFEFDTLGIYQFTACLIIFNPEDSDGKKLFPVVGQTAPGMIGTPAAMNSEGLAMGIDMFPSMLCDPESPGFNGPLLVRDCMQYCSTINYGRGEGDTSTDLVTRMINTKRGVSWIYPAADGKSGRSCIIEAGSSVGDKDIDFYMRYLPEYYQPVKEPIKKFISEIEKLNENSRTPAPVNGMMLRQADYKYPVDLITAINKKMWGIYDEDFLQKLYEFAKELSKDLKLLFHCKLLRLIRDLVEQLHELFRKPVVFDPYCFGERGFINKTMVENNQPGPFYFAPQRETREDVIVATNLGITPQMRLTAMSEWVALITVDDMHRQWRYDVLNDNILRAIDRAKDKKNPQLINEDIAGKIIDYLATYGDFPEYHNPHNEAWNMVPVDGSVSLFELKNKNDRYIKSHFGYYGDEWVKITLPNYI